MNPARETVTVRVPGSTSNCGSGFDTLGLALNLHNRITLTRTTSDVLRPERAGDARAGELVQAVVTEFFRESKAAPFGLSYRIEGDVPPARGLGSSATIIVGVLAGLDALAGEGRTRDQLARVGTAIEGNPENICAGIFGGFTVSRWAPTAADYGDTVRIPVSADLAFVVASPATEMPTKQSRGVLPATLAFHDAARSVNAAAFLTAALVTGDFEKLRLVRTDFMHEPYRLPRIPGARESIDRGIAAGALTGWLSGSGSSVLCVTRPALATAVAVAMKAAWVQNAVGCTVRVLAADNAGFRLE
jgi:homoserine kinase